MLRDRFKHIWALDFEFTQIAGERPSPICMVARELRSGAIVRLGPDDLRALQAAPFSVGNDFVLVGYYVAAEMSCFLALGWSLPANVLDLYVEFFNQTNGRQLVAGRGLVGALIAHELTGIPFCEKVDMRSLAMRGGPYDAAEVKALIEYCETDVQAVAALLRGIAPFDLDQAMLRGRYMSAVARMEVTGVPIDAEVFTVLRDRWDDIKTKLVEHCPIPVFEGNHFRVDSFEDYLQQRAISWPRLSSGRLNLQDDTFRCFAKRDQALSDLRELRHALDQLRMNELAVGHDCRNRTMLSAFQSKTSRNQPSTSKFIFGSSVWLRGLIRPEPGRFLAYVDWSGQEYGIAAALSGDAAMMYDYQTGDPYLAFGRAVGIVPKDATKATHAADREALKVALGLGAMYGAGAMLIAQTIGQQVVYAEHLLTEHRRRYSRFWKWRDSAVNYAQFNRILSTVYGWNIHLSEQVSTRSLANFPMQANGAEMMRMACIRTTESGIAVCCPAHDALLVEGPISQQEEIVAETRRLMARASRDVLGDFELRTGVETVVYPDRYRDEKRGGAMWDRVMGILNSINLKGGAT